VTKCAENRYVEENTRFLRRAEAGFGLFDQLCYEHYRFSMEACRTLGGAPFVKASTLCLLLIHDYSSGRVGAEELGKRFEAGIATSPELAELARESVGELARLLAERDCLSAAAPWALVDTVEIYVDALGLRRAGAGVTEIGLTLIERFEEWASEMPLSEAWSGAPDAEILRELLFLRRSLLRTEQVWHQFSHRLAARFPDDRRLARLVAQIGKQG
jgi:hypothetical protein